MSTRNLAWGVTGGVSLLVAALGCSGTQINDVGNLDSGGAGGSRATGGSGGSTQRHVGSAGSVGDSGGSGGSDTHPADAAGSSSGGYFDVGGTGGYGGSDIPAAMSAAGAAGAPAGCFDRLNASNAGFDNLALGPQNAVFLDTHFANADVKNYADQLVFPGAAAWEAYANFPAVGHELAIDTTISLPADISRAPASLGQLYVTRQACQGIPAGGRTLKVQVWWKLGGAIGHVPTEGMALGAIVKNKTVWYDDTIDAFVSGGADANRPLNTLNRITLTHAFADGDMTDAGKIVVGLWLLEEYVLPTSFYIGDVEWE